jgi:hypothetical protein
MSSISVRGRWPEAPMAAAHGWHQVRRWRLLNEEDNEDNFRWFMPLSMSSVEHLGNHYWAGLELHGLPGLRLG